MNCEHVFDILTRGPFPTGEPTDWQVERHLASCHECRQLAEALRPAVALFHECIHSDEQSELPGYRGRLHHLSTNTANMEFADDFGVSDESRSVRPAKLSQALPPVLPTTWSGSSLARGLNGWGNVTAAGLLAGLVLAVLLGWQWKTRPAAPQIAEDRPWPSAIMRPAPNERGQLLLARLNLPTECRDASHLPQRRLALLATLPSSQDPELPHSFPHSTSDAETYLCCTHCHNAHARQPSTAHMVAATVRSCEACHQPAHEWELALPQAPL